MPALRTIGIAEGAAVNKTATQGASSSTYSTSTWGVAPAPINVVPPVFVGSSLIGGAFDLSDDDEWAGPVSSFNYRLKLVSGGVGTIEPGITSFPAEILSSYAGKVPVLGKQAVGPYASSEWVEVTGPAVTYPLPEKPVPSFGASTYNVGNTVTLNLGSSPGNTLTVESFVLAGQTRAGSLTGSGGTRSWNTTGELQGGTMTLVVRATNGGGGYVLSDPVTSFLILDPARFFPASLQLNAVAGRVSVLDLEAFGTEDSLTINSISAGRILRRSDGKYTLDLADLRAAQTITVSYTAVKATYANIAGTATITVAKSAQDQGWGAGRHYYLPVNGSDEVIAEPGQRHRKVYVSAAGINATQVATLLGGLPYSIGSIAFSAQPEVGSTITLGAPRNVTVGGVTTTVPPVVVTFVASGATGNQVNIGANLAATMTNLATMLNASEDLTLNKATYTAAAAALNIVHDGQGTAGNTFQMAASGSPASNGTPSGATLSGGVTVTATYLRDTTVPGGLGGNGTWKYGEDPAVALDGQLASVLWGGLYPANSPGRSDHVFFRRGDDFSSRDWAVQGRCRGESRIHPVLFTAYGTGAPPIVKFPQVGGFLNAGNIVLQNLRPAGLYKFFLIDGLLIDGLTASGEESLGADSGSVVPGYGFTLRRAKFTDMAPPIGHSVNWNKPDLTWSNKGDRHEAFFIGGFDGNLVEKVFVDIAGWAEGYLLTFSKYYPKPPEIYSHCAYLAGAATAKPPYVRAVVNNDLTVRRCIFSRGSLTGFQFRPGGLCYDTIFMGNNTGLLVGGGSPNTADAVSKQGNYSAIFDNMVIWAGQKILQSKGMMAGGITLQGKLVAAINNFVCHSGPGNDGVTAHGTVDGSVPSEFEAFKIETTQGGSVIFDDTKVRAWINSSQDRNLSGLDTAAIDAATLEAFIPSYIGSAGDRRALMAYIRALTAPWDARNNLFSNYRPLFNANLPAAGAITTRTFRPDGRTPGMRWDCRFDWAGSVVPQPGDSINLAGHRVNKFENHHSGEASALNDLDMRGGELILHGGRTEVVSLSSAGKISIYGAGQFYMNGYTGANVITVEVGGGRFRNTGNITQGMDFIVSGPGELLFSANGGNVTIPAGRSLTIDWAHPNKPALVGWDGDNGAAPTQTIGGTVNMRSMMRLGFTGRDVTDRDPSKGVQSGKDFFPGKTIRGGTTTFSGTVVDVENASQSNGAIYVKYWTDIPQAGEDLIGIGKEFYIERPEGKIAVVSGTPTYFMPKIAKFNSGIYGANIANPNIAPAVTLQGSSVLNLDVTGLTPGSVHDLLVAASVTGTFGTVNITGGSGSVSYTSTKVILTVT